METTAATHPARLLTANDLGRRLRLSYPTVLKHLRRGVISPDFVAGSIHLFEPSRLPSIEGELARHRRKFRTAAAAA